MLDKLTAAESRYEQLMAEMADPAVQADTVKFRTHSKELAEMQPLIEHFRQDKEVAAQFAATEELVKDPDMRELAQEELKSLQARRDTLLAELKVLLIPKDPIRADRHGTASSGCMSPRPPVCLDRAMTRPTTAACLARSPDRGGSARGKTVQVVSLIPEKTPVGQPKAVTDSGRCATTCDRFPGEISQRRIRQVEA